MKYMSKRKSRKLRKSRIYAVLLVLIILCLGLYYFLFITNLEIKYNKNEFNINDNIYNYDLIVELKNGEIITEKKLIDTSTLGKHQEKLIIKDKYNHEKEYTIEYTIIGSDKIVITYNKELTTTKGTKIDLLKGVSAKNCNNDSIEVKVEGNYDFNKVGNYKLYYVAKDNNSETREEFVLKVIDNSNKPTGDIDDDKEEDKEFTTSKGFKGVTKNGITYIDGYLVANKTYSLPSTYNPGKLLQETQNAADQMLAAAKLDGFSIHVQSGFRSYETQKNLYNRYVSTSGKKEADTYSARPGHSEHQSGLAFDVCESTGKYKDACINSNFADTVEAKWLAQNAQKYGFILRYPKDKTNETGYIYESWHFRYVGKELAEKLYNNGDWITMESYFGITSEYNN